MTTLKTFLKVLALGLLFAPGLRVNAQIPADNRLPAAFSSDSTNLMAVVASYRDDVRQSVLRVSQHPQVLTRLAQQQVRSQQTFDSLIQSYGQTKKGWFYDVARYPGALHALATLPRADKARGRVIAQTLPPESQRSAWKLYRHHHTDLTRADSINQQAEQLFDSLVTPLTAPTQQSFRQLLMLPDLLALLTQQINQATLLGQAYQTDSIGTIQQLAVLHDSLTAQNQRELADYQRELSQDQLARQELLMAGQAYAQANGHDTSFSPDSVWTDSSVYYQNPYSYWFGYPSWYSTPFWYPSASWYGTGYGYGASGNLVVFGFPSSGFINWFFTRGFRTYPHLCDRFNAYYDRATNRHRFWTPRNSGFLLAAQRQFNPRYTDWSGHSNWLTRPRHYSRTTNLTGSNISIWTSSPRRYYSRPSRSHYTRSWSWGGSSTHSSSSVHHSGSFHSSSHSSGGYHGGSHSSRGPR